MSFESMSFDLSSVQWLVMTAIAIYAWVIGKFSARAKEHTALHLRVVELEARIKEMPSRHELTDLAVQIAKLAAGNKALLREIEANNKQQQMIHNFLLNQKG